MADWYVSSAAYALITQWASSTGYTVGQIIRPLTAPAANALYAFRCTVAGTTSGTEPTWSSAANNNSTLTNGGATFENVSGQSAYGWTACAGSLVCISGNGAGTTRFSVGDRGFMSSDSTETSSGFNYTMIGSTTPGKIQIISVNRTPNNIPPLPADQLSGAIINCASSSATVFDSPCDMYWQGLTFKMIASTSAGTITFNNTNSGGQYLRNCLFDLSGSTGASYVTANAPCPALTWDNTTIKFGATTQSIHIPTNDWHLQWINTPSAIASGSSIPASLFTVSAFNNLFPPVTARGVDLSSLNSGTIYLPSTSDEGGVSILFDSCNFPSSIVAYGSISTKNTRDNIEMVNCYNGSSIFSARYGGIGTISTNTSTYLASGAFDNVGSYSISMISGNSISTVSPLNNFFFDVNNTLIGYSHTATVEVLAPMALNNNELLLSLEYLGNSGNSLAEYVSTLPTGLTSITAIGTSTAVWSAPPAVTLNPSVAANVTFSGGNLSITATTSGSGALADAGYNFGAGKYYFEFDPATWSGFEIGVANTTAPLTGGTGGVYCTRTSGIISNGTASAYTLGILTAGTIVGCAVDFGAQLIWFRSGASGLWNGNATANPATGVNGASFANLGTSLPLYPAIMGGSTSDAFSVNFGASAFVGTAPSGFVAPNQSVPQHLQVAFTPETAGIVRAQVQLAKPSTLVYVNPQVTIT